MRTLDDVQEAALPYQTNEIADRVTSEFFVVEIHPEPNSQTTVVDVEGSGFGVTGNDKEHQQRLWELHPFFDVGCSVKSSSLFTAPSEHLPTSSGAGRRSTTGTTFIFPNMEFLLSNAKYK